MTDGSDGERSPRREDPPATPPKSGAAPRRPDQSSDFRATARRITALVTRRRGLFAGVLATGALSVGLTVAGPVLLGRATDLVVSGSFDDTGKGIDFPAVARMVAYAIAVYLVAGLCGVLQARMATVAVQDAAERLRRDVEAKLARVPLSYLDRRHRGEIISRVTNDIDNLAQCVQQVLSQLVVSVLTIVGVVAVMFWVSWLLALIALLTVPLSVLAVAWIGRWSQPEFTRQWQHTGRLNAHIEEMYTGHSLVKAFGREEQSQAAFDAENERLYEASRRAQERSGLVQPLMMFLGNLNYVLVAAVGGLRVASGALTVGDVQAFIQYSRQFSQPLGMLAGMLGMVQSGVASAERVFELLDAPDQAPDPAEPDRPTAGVGRVAFEDVSFRYVLDTPLIEGLSLVAEPGHTVAIVGPTGAGKTTLVNLLMRFYDVTGGRITLDGVDTASMSRADLRSRIGMVLQDTWLFRGTIAENIAYGSEHATRDHVVDAAKAAHADRFIRTLPDGYDTVVDDESGSGISAGEKQLLTIARAFLTEPTILVLDEATSSVDTRTEVLIQQAMARLRRGRTAFVIAHRLSTIRDADTIVVMENGTIVEQGSHDQLVVAGGAYSRLYAAQFADATAEVD
ncbi:ABC transporter ATP-binding protein [Yinghuangia sp. YIM S09857]|uniref:ABC transporter ATP-binding protein n=1 Tax=Yinghuangia sp. YIM S09857 TaxID=3436929 RepID=UPI003F53628D